MKSSFKYLVYVFLCLSLVINLASAEVDVDGLAKNRPTKIEYPNDETIIMYEGVDYTLHPDGRISKQVHRVRSLFNENAMDQYGDIFVDFYDYNQELKIERCRAYMIDGRIVDSYENAFNQITPFALGKTPDYVGFQRMVITHTGLEWEADSDLGSVSELLYTITDREPFQGWMEGVEYFQSDEYIIWKEVRVSVPENVMLKFEFLNGDGDVKQTIKEGVKTWTWTVRNVPHILHDDAYPYRLRFAPTLVFTTCPDWKYAAHHFAKRISGAVGSSEGVKAAADDIIEDRTEPYFIIEELSKLVRERVRTINHGSETFRWHHRNAGKTLSTAYGNALDKAILLTALLKSQGLPADLAVSSEVHQPSLSVPALSKFDQFWVVTEKNGEEFFVDPLKPLSQHSRKDIAGHAVFKLNYAGNPPEIEPNFLFESSKIILTVKVKVEDDGSYSGSGYFRAGGCFSPYFAVAANSEGAGGWLKGNMSGLLPNIEISNGTARELSAENCKFTFDFTGEKLGDADEGYLLLEAPHSPISIDGLAPAGFHSYYTEHKNPIYFKGVGSLFIAATFELPDSWSVARAPEGMRVDSPIASAVVEVGESDHKLDLTANFSIKDSIIDPEDYQSLRDLYSRKRNSHTHIVFKVE